MQKKQDFLSRQPYINLLKSIIANQSNNPLGYSFAIDGEWGCGKTWILTELESQLEDDSKNKYLIFHYNAWENDFYEEPLVAILSVMIEKLNHATSQKSLYEATIDELLRQASADLLTLVSGIVKEVTKIDAEEIIKRKKGFFKRIKENTKLSAKDINTLVPLQYTLQEVRNNLKKLSEKFHIILIVDELDRCLPEYAIKVLERLHHICNEMPVIQILTINKNSLADSISKVFGKDYSHNNESGAWTTIFFETYFQKFVDIIIPLPNGKIDTKVEVLNGLEKDYKPYIRPSNDGQELIKLDDDFLATFISSLMNEIPKRLQEKIFKQVALCHKLSLQSGVQYNEEQMTYVILIYEILSCISRFVYHAKDSCKFLINNDYYTLDFYNGISLSVIPETFEYATFQKNLQNFLNYPVNHFEDIEGSHRYAFEIFDTKSYILAFFTKQEVDSYDPLQNGLWHWIAEDKIFLKKYDEIMDMLIMK
ncbi:MAG: KAP family NTPase [Treponema sp.]|nr:KAP family NTPase [Treponema sp.]